jgi:hypothetical protein
MAGQPSGSEGVVVIRHPRGLEPFQPAWISAILSVAGAAQAQLTSSFCAPKRKMPYHGTPFIRSASMADPRNLNAAWAQLTASERARPQLWSKSALWRNLHFNQVSVAVLPQKPFVTAQFPAVGIPADRARKRNQQVRLTTLSDGYITANLVAPSFDAVWMVAMDQLANSWRAQYVQNLTLSPGLGRNFQGGGYLTPAPPFDTSTFPWNIQSFVMGRGKPWPKLVDQKSSFGLLDTAKVQAILASQANSFRLAPNPASRDARFRQVDWNVGAWVGTVSIVTFDPRSMSVLITGDQTRKRKWWTSDPTQLSWLIPSVLYDTTFFAPIPAQERSFRANLISRERRLRQYDPDLGWLFNATPPFDPRNMAWAIQADRVNKWSNFRDDRQRRYDPDNAWNVFHPELIDWTNHDTRMARMYAKIQSQQHLSEMELAWITANVPAIDPTIWIAVVQQLNSERARGIYRDVRRLTEMVQISWLFEPNDLEANIPPVVDTTVDLDPHFTTSPSVMPYWLVYPRRGRHRRGH